MPPCFSCLKQGHLSSEVTGAFCLVPSTSLSLRLGILYLSTSVGLGYGLMLELFPGSTSLHAESINHIQFTFFVTSNWFRNINLIPIDYAFRPRLRGRLTLRRLTLRRKPWTFGESVSHTFYATHISILSCDTSSKPYDSPSTAYTMLRYRSQKRARIFGV